MGGDPLSNIASPPRLEEEKGNMTLKDRLIKKKEELDKKALRDLRTVKEYAIRNKWERVSNILKKRYNRYGDDTKYGVMQEDDGYPD